MPKDKQVDLSDLSKREFPFIKDINYEQEEYIQSIFHHLITISNSKAGTGKTWGATQAMNVLLKKGVIDRVYYLVSPVEEHSLGFLPGDLASKIYKYSTPFIQALTDIGVSQDQMAPEILCNEDLIGDYKVLPHTFTRGRNFEHCGIILDECQNWTVGELKKALTRIKDDCKVAMIGHDGQIDIKSSQSGFTKYIHHFKEGYESGIFTDVGFVTLTEDHRGLLSRFADEIH